jgi:hypothetical protein
MISAYGQISEWWGSCSRYLDEDSMIGRYTFLSVFASPKHTELQRHLEKSWRVEVTMRIENYDRSHNITFLLLVLI